MPIEPVDLPDSREEDAPPKVERTPKRKAPGTAKLKEQVAELYATIGLIAITPLDPLAGTLLVTSADDLAEQWVALAETNETVKRALKKLVEAGGWGGVVMAHAMIVMPVLANRGMFPDHIAGPIAAMAVVQHPEAAPHFSHPRFQDPSQTNGNGAS